MRYEIITDSSDLLVLVVNSRTVAICHRMSAILDLIEEDYNNHRNKQRRVYNPALIHPELDKEEDKKVETPDDRELGRLFGL